MGANPYLIVTIGAIFVNNFILSQFLGICPFLGVSKKTDSAIGMGLAVIFVMGIASIITYAVNLLLVKWGVGYIQTIVFILVIAALVQCVEIVIKKFSPSLYNALGVYLPLITTNCAVLGVAIVNVSGSYNLIQAFLNGIFSGVGFTLAIVLMAGLREKLVHSDVPKAFDGFPITLVAASIMSMAFIAFGGMI